MFRKFLEAIETPPHMPVQYLKAHKEAFDKIEGMLKQINFQELEKLKTWVGSMTRRSYSNILDDLNRLGNNIERHKPSYWIDVILSGDSKYIKNITDDTNISKALGKIDTEKSFEEDPNGMDAIKEIKGEIELNKKDWDESEYGDYNQQIKNLNLLKNTLQLANKMKEWYPKFISKLKTIVAFEGRNANKYYNNVDPKPPHEKTETLYHATTAVSNILKTGFKTRAELGRGALGGGPDDQISFTSDQQIAEAIVWAIRRAIEIATGKMNIKQLETLATNFGANWQKIVAYETSALGGPIEWKWEDDKNNPHSFMQRNKRPRTEQEKRQWAFEAFRFALMDQNRVYNPVFSNVTANDFANLNTADVGVLAAEVDMDKVDQYLPSMEEYRVPVSAILKVWKVPYRSALMPHV